MDNNQSFNAAEFMHKAEKATEKGNSSEALRWLNKILEKDPHHVKALNLCGVIFYEQDEFENAKKSFISAIENDPTFVDAQRNYGEILLKEADYENGIKTFVKILENHPDDVPTLLRMAQLSSEAERLEDAELYSQRVLELDPENGVAKEIQELLPQLHAQQDPENGKEYQLQQELYEKALTAREQGDNDSAFIHIKDILERNPSNAAAYNMAGMIFFEVGEIKNAKKSFLAAISCDTDFLEARRNLAEVMFEMEEYDKGIKIYAGILDEHPDDVLTLLRMAELNAEAGRKKEARDFAQKALKYEPENVKAQELIDTI